MILQSRFIAQRRMHEQTDGRLDLLIFKKFILNSIDIFNSQIHNIYMRNMPYLKDLSNNASVKFSVFHINQVDIVYIK